MSNQEKDYIQSLRNEKARLETELARLKEDVTNKGTPKRDTPRWSAYENIQTKLRDVTKTLQLEMTAKKINMSAVDPAPAPVAQKTLQEAVQAQAQALWEYLKDPKNRSVVGAIGASGITALSLAFGLHQYAKRKEMERLKAEAERMMLLGYDVTPGAALVQLIRSHPLLFVRSNFTTLLGIALAVGAYQNRGELLKVYNETKTIVQAKVAAALAQARKQTTPRLPKKRSSRK